MSRDVVFFEPLGCVFGVSFCRLGIVGAYVGSWIPVGLRWWWCRKRSTGGDFRVGGYCRGPLAGNWSRGGVGGGGMLGSVDLENFVNHSFLKSLPFGDI